MRAFIAIELPGGFADETERLARQLEALVEGRFMRRESYHLTLAFLGDVDAAGRAAAMDAMDRACGNAHAVPLASDGLGTFGKAADATLWLGIREDGGLGRLAALLRGELVSRGVGFDPKPFRAHITLARRARIPRRALPPLAFPGSAEARAVTLFESELSRGGAAYQPLHTARLS